MMNKVILAFALVFSILSNANSQSCFPDGLHLFMQYQIDDFLYENPDCTVIEGDLMIGDWSGTDDIYNLNGLKNIKAIGGHLTIAGLETLNNLSGLDSLQSVGGYVFIHNNDAIINLNELQSLNSIGNALVINNCDQLTSIESLSSITSLGAELGLTYNKSLRSLNGLEYLTSIYGKLEIFNNDSLNDINALQTIDPNTMHGKLIIANNPFLSDCDISSVCGRLLISTDSLLIENNNEGCNNLEELQEKCESSSILDLGSSDEMILYPNPANQVISILLKNGKTIKEVNIYTLLGQKLLLERSHKNTLNVSSLKNGVYIIEIISDDSRYRTKLTVKN